MQFTPTGSRISYTLPPTYRVRNYDNRYFGNGWTARATCGSEVLGDTAHETRTWARHLALELCFAHWQAALRSAAADKDAQAQVDSAELSEDAQDADPSVEQWRLRHTTRQRLHRQHRHRRDCDCGNCDK